MRYYKEFILVLSLSTTAWSRYLLRRDDFKILSDLQADLDDLTALEDALNQITSPNTATSSSSSSAQPTSDRIDTSSSSRDLANALRSLTANLDRTVGDISAATPITDTNAAQMLNYLTMSIKPRLLDQICPLLKSKASVLKATGLDRKTRQALFVDTSYALDRLCVSLKIKVPTSRVNAVVNLQKSFTDDFTMACDPWSDHDQGLLIKQDL